MTIGVQTLQAPPNGFWNAAAISIATALVSFFAQQDADAQPAVTVELCHNDNTATITATVTTANGTFTVRRFVSPATGQVLTGVPE